MIDMSPTLRKGISPLIAATLLIAFTMSIALLVGPFFTDLIQTSQEGQTEEAEGLIESSKSSLEIEQVAYDTDSGNYTVTISNNGQNTIENYTAKVLGDSPTQESFYKSIEPGEAQRFKISTPSGSSEDELSVEALNKPVAASTSLDTAITGSAPASPSNLDASIY